MAEQSMSDDLSAAWDTVAEKGGDNEQTTETQSQSQSASEKIGSPQSGDQKAAEKSGEKGGEKGSEKIPADQKTGAGNADAAPASSKPASAAADSGAQGHKAAALDAAPKSLPPAAREAWKDTPPAMREAIARREADYEAGIAKYRDNAKRAEAMDAVLNPFAQFFAMNGNQPAETVSGVLQTAAVLQMGSPAQKAQTVANLIKQFGIDIGTLDSALVGERSQVSEFEQLLNQRLGPLQQQLQQYQQRDQQQAQQSHQRVASDITAFANDAANEFYEDVRLEMADILDLAANQGRPNMSLKDAYDKACLLHPEISVIVRNRQAAAALPDKRRAASSIHGTQGGEGDSAPPETLRGALEAAWDAARA